MDRLRAMQVFVAVVESGSLSAAGRRLRMPLATVSRKLSELEAHLHAPLLRRSTRRLALTDAGREYVVEHADASSRNWGNYERTVAGEYRAPRGELVVAAPIVFGRTHVLPVVNAFLRAYPEVDARLVLGDRIVNLHEDQIDLAVRIGALPDSRLAAVQVGSIRRVVCGSPEYFAHAGVPATPDESLRRHPCISFETLAPPGVWRFDHAGAEDAVPVHARLVVNTAEAAIDAASAGIGVTRVLSYQVEVAQRAGALQIVLRDYEPAAVPVHLVYAPAQRLPLKVRASSTMPGAAFTRAPARKRSPQSRSVRSSIAMPCTRQCSA